MISHLPSGAVTGGVFVVALPVLGVVVIALTLVLLRGVVSAGLLFVVAAVLWMRLVFRIAPEMSQVGLFFINPQVDGVVFGSWVELGDLP